MKRIYSSTQSLLFFLSLLFHSTNLVGATVFLESRVASGTEKNERLTEALGYGLEFRTRPIYQWRDNNLIPLLKLHQVYSSFGHGVRKFSVDSRMLLFGLGLGFGLMQSQKLNDKFVLAAFYGGSFDKVSLESNDPDQYRRYDLENVSGRVMSLEVAYEKSIDDDVMLKLGVLHQQHWLSFSDADGTGTTETAQNRGYNLESQSKLDRQSTADIPSFTRTSLMGVFAGLGISF